MADIKAKDVTKNAKNMKKDGYVYVYGYKGTKVTKEGVQSLAKQYPNVFTSTIKAMAMGKVGKIGIDCSGYVNKAAKINLGGSTSIKVHFKSNHKVSDDKYVMDGMGIWHNGHIALIEVDENGNAFINEARSTSHDLTRTSWAERAKDFEIYGKIPGVNYNAANIKGIGSIEATSTIKTKCTLYKKCDTKSGKLQTLDVNTTIKIIKDKKNGWSKVWVSGKTGYVKNSCIKRVAMSNYKTATVNTKAYLRKNNSKVSKKLKTVIKGTKVKVICKRKFWTNVIVDGVSGWIATKKINF